MGECPSCYNSSCPEVVPVTINQNTYNIDSVGLTIVVDTALDGLSSTLTITADVQDFINLNCYFTKSLTSPGDKTISAPTTPGWIEDIVTTDSTGVAVINVAYAGPTDTWYLIIQGINGVLAMSDEITIGV